MNDHVLLCVDDEVSVLRSLRRCLRKEDYQILTAPGGEEGLALLETHPVHVVLSDQRMPEMTGTQFLQQVKERFPDTVRLVLSGYADAHAILESINQGEIYRFLSKPWHEEELKTTLRQCFDRYDLLQQNRDLVVRVRKQNEVLQHLNEHLEQAVEDRTMSLQFAQEILEKLPYATLGISRERIAAFANAAARHLLSTTPFFLGADMHAFLPPAMVEAVEPYLEGDLSNTAHLPVLLNGREVQVQIIPLGEKDNQRGCVLLIADG